MSNRELTELEKDFKALPLEVFKDFIKKATDIKYDADYLWDDEPFGMEFVFWLPDWYLDCSADFDLFGCQFSDGTGDILIRGFKSSDEQNAAWQVEMYRRFGKRYEDALKEYYDKRIKSTLEHLAYSAAEKKEWVYKAVELAESLKAKGLTVREKPDRVNKDGKRNFLRELTTEEFSEFLSGTELTRGGADSEYERRFEYKNKDGGRREVKFMFDWVSIDDYGDFKIKIINGLYAPPDCNYYENSDGYFGYYGAWRAFLIIKFGNAYKNALEEYYAGKRKGDVAFAFKYIGLYQKLFLDFKEAIAGA